MFPNPTELCDSRMSQKKFVTCAAVMHKLCTFDKFLLAQKAKGAAAGRTASPTELCKNGTNLAPHSTEGPSFI